MTIVAAGTRRVVLTRRQLDALARLGRGVPVDDAARRPLGAHALVEGRAPQPRLQPVARALALARHRVAVRRWVGGARPVVEAFAGPAGIVVLPGGPGADDPQDVAWHPRPAALGRVLGGMLDIPTLDGPPVVDGRARPWADLVALANDAATGVALLDLRWSPRPGAPLVSVMVLAWHRDGGIVEVGRADVGDLVRCRPRHPLAVWSGLTDLARRVSAG